jgi:hypothetical protein
MGSSYAVPDEILALDERERAFVEGVVLDGRSPRQAALVAGYVDHYQTRLVRRPKIAAAFRSLRLPDSHRLIASVGEVRERLTAILRDPGTRAGDKTTAASLLLKVDGALGPETYVDARQQSVVYQIGAGTPAALLDVLDVLARLADGEAVQAPEAARVLQEYTQLAEAGHGSEG